MKNIEEEVLKLLLKIPKSRVTTYRELAKTVKTSPRHVGRIMKNNKHPEKFPCYKVIKSNGKMGGYCGKLSGKMIEKKAALLKKDGIEIVNGKINLRKYMHRFIL